MVEICRPKTCRFNGADLMIETTHIIPVESTSTNIMPRVNTLACTCNLYLIRKDVRFSWLVHPFLLRLVSLPWPDRFGSFLILFRIAWNR
jgi:hypothetical protein